MGPADAGEALRKALSMGGDKAVHVLDDALHGSDALATSAVLAKAVERIGFDLVLSGMASTDASMGVVPAMLAERLGVPQLSYAGDLKLDGTTVTIKRETDAATETVDGSLAGGGQRHRPHRRGPLPVVQGHHGGEEEAGRDLVPGRPRYRPGHGRPRRRRTRRCSRRQSARRGRPGEVVKDDGEGGIRLAEYLSAPASSNFP